jgi:hypothetical protein
LAGPFQPSSAWTDAFLEPMRQVGDSPADLVITSMFAVNDVQAVNGLMRNLVTNEGMVPENLPQVVKTFLAMTENLPPFADPGKIKIAEDIFFVWGPQIILILHCYSLPYCYAARKGVQVLALTGRLSNNASRRIIEVAQMIVDMMQTGGLTSDDGRGRKTLQKVRLMHAAVRFLASRAETWDLAWGLPINQEDLGATLMSFSWIMLDGLDKLGIRLTPEQQEAWLHTWQVIGEQLGLREDVIPADLDSAAALAVAFQRRQYGACPEGKLMTSALIQAMQYELPGNTLDGLPALFIQHFMGAEYAGLLGVEGGLADGLSMPVALFGKLLTEANRDECIADAADKLSKLLINAAVLVARGGTRPTFAIPDQLKQQWGVNWLG